ncbi:MAG: RNA polymerase sigma factor [Planctomycetes bacterium]|nr:RNA polymerase sigma factor [Planctomycetota bacterium]
MKPELETLLTQTNWLRTLARRLVHDEAQAEDLVQRTMLRAIERPPRGTTGVRSWLAIVARRLAARDREQERGRARREERVARGEALPSTLELVEKVALQRRLSRAVLELDEPYREVLLLRYFEGLEPTEIAQEKNLPAATVRTRIHRALAMLRGRFEREQQGDVSWRALFAPLVGKTFVTNTTPISRTPWIALGALFAMKTKFNVCLLLALLLGTLWVLWGDRLPAFVEPQELGRAPRGEVDSSAQTSELRETAGQSLRTPARPNGKSPATDTADPTGQEPGRTLIVIDPEGDRVADLPVTLLDLSRDSEVRGAWEQHRGANMAFLRRHGEERTTDEQGTLRLPYAPLILVVAHESSRGIFHRELTPEAEERVELVLEPRRVVRIEVVDSKGGPVPRVPIHLLCGVRGRPDGPRSMERVVAHDFTNDAGYAEVAFAPSWTRRSPLLTPTAVLSLQLPLGELEPREIDLTNSELPIQRFVLPEAGSMSVRIEDELGRLWQGTVHLHVIAEDVEDDAGRPWFQTTGTTEDGIFSVPHVDFDRRLIIEATPANRAWDTVERITAGPTRLEPHRTVALRAGETARRVTGRLLDGNAQVLSKQRILALWNVYEAGSTTKASDVLETDEEGRFSLRIDPVTPHAVLRRLHLVHWTPANRGQLDEAPSRYVDLTEPLRPGDNERGDLLLLEPTLLIEGHVLDASGRPVPDARLVLIAHTYDDVGPVPAPSRGDEEARWARTRDDGAFAIRGPAQWHTFLVGADTPTSSSRSQEFTRGQRDVVITLRQRGKLPGRVVVEPTFHAHLMIEVIEANGRKHRPHPDQDGTFLCDNLEQGLVALEVSVWPVGLVRRVENLYVSPEGALDGRMDPLDLFGQLRRVTLTVRSASDARLEVVELASTDPERPWRTGAVPSPEGEIELVVPKEVTKLQVRARDHGTARVVLASQARVSVTLEPR